jgi:glycosyltransferase involved in cell wall biosynthesis
MRETRGAEGNGPLRVAIDAHMVGEQETGNETYIVNLIRGLDAIDAGTEYLLYSPHPKSLAVCGPLGSNFSTRTLSRESASWRILRGLPRQVRADRAHVLHVTYIAPPVISVPVVASVHDISYALFPEMFSRRDRAILGTLVPRTLKQAAAVITVSENSKAAIVSHYGTAPDKIFVTYPEPSPIFQVLHDASMVADVRHRYRIDGRFIIAVGNLQPRKNLRRLVQAFAQLRVSGGYTGRLVLIGKSKFKQSEIFAEVRARGLEQEVILTGYISNEELAALYNAADALVYPSLYEGFGIPPSEAMACGCPVITSSSSSLPEVVGDAGLLVDPTKVDDIASAIVLVTGDPLTRATLVSRGFERVKQFSAATAAQQTLDIYQRVAGFDAQQNTRSHSVAAK